MNREELLALLQPWGVAARDDYYEEAFSRNLGILDAAEMDRLSRATVAVAGLGGVGGVHVATMARSGVGGFRLADMDRYEPVNVNRQFGARVPDFGRPKLDVMTEQALCINPHLRVETFAEGVTPENVDAFLDGADVVLDGLDFFVFDVRRMLFKRAVERGIPVITAGPLGFSSALLVFRPRGMGFDEYFDITDDLPDTEKYLRFAMGLAPKPTHLSYLDTSSVSLESRKGPSLGIACQLCSALAATEAVRLILDRPSAKGTPYFLQFDPYSRKLHTGRIRWGNRGPVQRAKLWFVREVLLQRNKLEGLERPAEPSAVAPGGQLGADQIDFLLRAAVRAPSGDNVQPWRFTVEDGRGVVLHLDPSADVSFFNVRQIASIIACGAAVENMVVAASGLGLRADVETSPSTGSNGMARLEFLPDESVREDLLADAIWKRCTNRKMYKRRQIPDGVWQRLDRETEPFDDARLHWVNDRDGLRTLSKAIFLADRIRAERKDLHIYFNGMIRWDKEEAERTRDGLPLKNLYAGAAGEGFLKFTKPWERMRVANRLGIGRMVAMHSRMGIRSSGGCGLVTVGGTDDLDFLLGGRALERVWLKLAFFNLRMQPMTAVTLFRLRWDLEGPEAFSPKHQRMLRRVWQMLDEVFPEAKGRAPVMLFRAGFGSSIRHGTWRREPETFLENGEEENGG